MHPQAFSIKPIDIYDMQRHNAPSTAIPNGLPPAPVVERPALPLQTVTQAVAHWEPAPPTNIWSNQTPPYTPDDNQLSQGPQAQVLTTQAAVAFKRKRLDSNDMDPRNAKEQRTLDRPVRDGPLMYLPPPMQSDVPFPVDKMRVLLPDGADFPSGLGASMYIIPDSDSPNSLAWSAVIIVGRNVYDYICDLPTPHLRPYDRIVVKREAGITAGIALGHYFLIQFSPVPIIEIPQGFQSVPAAILTGDDVQLFVQIVRNREYARRTWRFLRVRIMAPSRPQASQDGTDPENMRPPPTGAYTKAANSPVDAQRAVLELAQQARVSTQLEIRQGRSSLNSDSGRPLWPTRPGSGLPPLADGHPEPVRKASLSSGQDSVQPVPGGGRPLSVSWGVDPQAPNRAPR